MKARQTTLRVQRKRCATCIFRKDSSLDLRALLDAVRDKKARGFAWFKGYRICHYSRNAVCAGFWEKYRDRFQLGQIAQRLGFVELVDDCGTYDERKAGAMKAPRAKKKATAVG